MPDPYGFDHLVEWGKTYHRCIECDEFPFGTRLSEKQRERHHSRHENARKHEIERSGDWQRCA